MDRHLNVFFPYERLGSHEDQLTRAAMIVMRAIPLARDALLARIGTRSSARLPEPEMDIQTKYVLEVPASDEGGGRWLNELISVFLSPDEGRDLSTEEIKNRDGEQRLDGVLRYPQGRQDRHHPARAPHRQGNRSDHWGTLRRSHLPHR